MLYRALRGVCIGPERHLTPDDAPVALDAGTARFLLSINAIEEVPVAADPAPASEAAHPVNTPAPAPAGKKEK